MFTPKIGEMIQFDSCFFRGLEPPARCVCLCFVWQVWYNPAVQTTQVINPELQNSRFLLPTIVVAIAQAQLIQGTHYEHVLLKIRQCSTKYCNLCLFYCKIRTYVWVLSRYICWYQLCLRTILRVFFPQENKQQNTKSHPFVGETFAPPMSPVHLTAARCCQRLTTMLSLLLGRSHWELETPWNEQPGFRPWK